MMGDTDRYDELAKWTNDQWIGLLNKYAPPWFSFTVNIR